MGVIGEVYRSGAPYSLTNVRDEQFCWHCKNQGLVILDSSDCGVPCPMCAKGRCVDIGTFDGSFWIHRDWKSESWNVGMDWTGADVRRNTNPVALRVMERYRVVIAKLGGERPTLGGLMRLVERGELHVG